MLIDLLASYQAFAHFDGRVYQKRRLVVNLIIYFSMKVRINLRTVGPERQDIFRKYPENKLLYVLKLS